MKTCPVCDHDFPDQHTTCPTDGAVLIESPEFAPGQLIRSKYRIVRKLGQGGMGIVYLAEDILLGIEVALKFLAGDLGKDPKFIKRFRTEARAAYQLRHPNIVEVTNLDQAEDGSLFIAMEFVDGSGLRSLMDQKRGTLEVHRALEITRGVAAGLVAAHAKGTVHRDIKPENILLASLPGERELPKIADFGIVAMTESVTRISHTQGLLLTPDYAAPEQWHGLPAEDMDGRTDLYALGGVLYELLTGKTPFRAKNLQGWMHQHLHVSPEPPSRLRPELADYRGLDALVLHLLAKDVNERPTTALDFLAELNGVEWVQEVRPSDSPKRPIPVRDDHRDTVAEESLTPSLSHPKTIEQTSANASRTPQSGRLPRAQILVAIVLLLLGCVGMGLAAYTRNWFGFGDRFRGTPKPPTNTAVGPPTGGGTPTTPRESGKKPNQAEHPKSDNKQQDNLPPKPETTPDARKQLAIVGDIKKLNHVRPIDGAAEWNVVSIKNDEKPDCVHFAKETPQVFTKGHKPGLMAEILNQVPVLKNNPGAAGAEPQEMTPEISHACGEEFDVIVFLRNQPAAETPANPRRGQPPADVNPTGIRDQQQTDPGKTTNPPQTPKQPQPGETPKT